MRLIKKIIVSLASELRVWVFLRKALEFNFHKQKKIIKDFFPCLENDMLLDLGCGTGDFSVCFPKDSYIGIDMSEDNIKYAYKKYKKIFLKADGGSLPFKDIFFTKILIVGVLHHLSSDDCEKIFKEIKRVLKPEGKILIMESVKTNILPLKIIQSLDMGAHIRPREDWISMFKDNFEIKKEWKFINGLISYSAFLMDKK